MMDFPEPKEKKVTYFYNGELRDYSASFTNKMDFHPAYKQ